MKYTKGSGSIWEDNYGDPKIKVGSLVVLPSEFREDSEDWGFTPVMEKHAGEIVRVDDIRVRGEIRFARIQLPNRTYSYYCRDLELFTDSHKETLERLLSLCTITKYSRCKDEWAFRADLLIPDEDFGGMINKKLVQKMHNSYTKLVTKTTQPVAEQPEEIPPIEQLQAIDRIFQSAIDLQDLGLARRAAKAKFMVFLSRLKHAEYGVRNQIERKIGQIDSMSLAQLSFSCSIHERRLKELRIHTDFPAICTAIREQYQPLIQPEVPAPEKKPTVPKYQCYAGDWETPLEPGTGDLEQRRRWGMD